MPSTPTFDLRTSDSGYIALSVTNPSTPPDHNQVWRSASDEYDGLPIKISDSLKVNGIFIDWNAASGKTYTYFIRAVDGGGATADSATQSGIITLNQPWLHAVSKILKSTNADPSIPPLQLFNVIPHNENFAHQSEAFLYGSATKPDVEVAEIEGRQIAFAALVELSSEADLRNLKAFYQADLYICFRDALGNKVFGTLGPYSERYDAFTNVPLVIENADFTEAL